MNPERNISPAVADPHNEALLSREANQLLHEADPARRMGALAEARNNYADALARAGSFRRNNPLVNLFHRATGRQDANQALEAARLRYEGGEDVHRLVDPAPGMPPAMIEGVLPRFVQLAARRTADASPIPARNPGENDAQYKVRVDDAYRKCVANAGGEVLVQEARDLVRAQVERNQGLRMRWNPLLESALGWGLNAAIGVSAMSGALPLTAALVAARVAVGTRAGERMLRAGENFMAGRFGERRNRSREEIFGNGAHPGMDLEHVDRALADHLQHMARSRDLRESDTVRMLLDRKHQLSSQAILASLEGRDVSGAVVRRAVENWRPYRRAAEDSEVLIENLQAERAMINPIHQQSIVDQAQRDIARANELDLVLIPDLRTERAMIGDLANHERTRDQAQAQIDRANEIDTQLMPELVHDRDGIDLADQRTAIREATRQMNASNSALSEEGTTPHGIVRTGHNRRDVERVCKEIGRLDNIINDTTGFYTATEKANATRNRTARVTELETHVTDPDAALQAFVDLNDARGKRIFARQLIQHHGQLVAEIQEKADERALIGSIAQLETIRDQAQANIDRANEIDTNEIANLTGERALIGDLHHHEQARNEAQRQIDRANEIGTTELPNQETRRATAHQLSEDQAILVHDILLGTPVGAPRYALDTTGRPLNDFPGLLRTNRLNREQEEVIRNQRRNAVIRTAVGFVAAAAITWATMPPTEVINFVGVDPMFGDSSSLHGQGLEAIRQAFAADGHPLTGLGQVNGVDYGPLGQVLDPTRNPDHADIVRRILENNPLQNQEITRVMGELPGYEHWISINSPDANALMNGVLHPDLLNHVGYSNADILAPDPRWWFFGDRPHIPYNFLPNSPFPAPGYFNDMGNAIQTLGHNLIRAI